MMYDICFIAHNVLITVYFNTIIYSINISVIKLKMKYKLISSLINKTNFKLFFTLEKHT